VRRLWVWHRGGAAVETLLKRYPNLGPARVLDALAFAYDNQELIEADIAREQALFEKQGGPSVGARPLAQLTLPFLDAGAPEGDARGLRGDEPRSAAAPPAGPPAPNTPASSPAPAPAAGRPAAPGRSRSGRR
jgi:hypothetical protein